MFVDWQFDRLPSRIARHPVKRGVRLRRYGTQITSSGRVVLQGRQERGAGMAEIIFELRLIFPRPLAVAVSPLG